MATTIEYNIKVNDQGALTSIGAMEDELSRLNEEIKQVDVNSQAFAELATKIGNVEAQLEGAQAGLQRFTAEDKVKAFQGSIDVLGGSIASVTGAVGLLGVESEEFDKLTARAASAIAFASGIKQASDGAIALSQSLAKSSKAQKLFAAATALTTKGMGKLKIALISTGIGAIVVAVGLLVANFDKVSAAVTKFIGKSKFLTNIVDTARNAFNSFIDSIRPALEYLGLLPDAAERAEIATRELAAATAEQSDKQLQLLRARGASAKEIYNEEIKLINSKIAATEDETEAEDLRFQKQLIIAKEEKRLADERAARAKEAADKRRAEKEAEAEEREAELQKAKDAEQARVDAIAAILANYEEKQRDLEAQTRLEKLELEETRKLEELERLKATEEEKLAIINYYKGLKKEAEALDEEERKAKEEEEKQKAADAIMESLDQEYMAAQQKIATRAMVVDAIAGLAGQETAIGKAAFIAQQAIRIQDLIATATSSLKKIAIDAGASTVDVAKGFSSTLKAGFPQNIPFLIAYAAQAAAIVGTIISAVGKSKSAIKTAVPGGGGGGVPTPRASLTAPTGGGATSPNSPFEQFTPAGTSPEALAEQQTVRAYVVGGDVTSTQEADAKINNRRSLAG